ncbi:YdcF family protein [Roseobacter sp. HKCCD7870]|uniref:YdcF family protein n=1 Tax=Roseobacter sp. HKCCD7870 TaxID=3120343 RepID=UPI0030EE9B07
MFSLPSVSKPLISFLEQGYTPITVEQVPEHETVVVLSGMLRTISNGSETHYEFNEAVDRILAGVSLINENRADRLILTRGHLPWSVGVPEGEYLADFIEDLGVERDQVVLTPVVQNTEDEAQAIAEMVNPNERVILVTSAFHMPRAEAVFLANGVQVTPYPVDFRGGASNATLIDFIPSAAALGATSTFVREMIGRLYYWLKH